MLHVILIEDDALVRTLLARRMTEAGWSVTALRDGRLLEEQIEATPADLLVVDIGLPHRDGLTLVEMLRRRGITAPVLIISAYELPHLHATVRDAGADGLLEKPFDQEELIERMQRLLAA